jgi:organic radical activating enzyme
MSIEDIEKLLQWKDWDDGMLKWIFILGGEPTLHPQLLEILDLIDRFDPRIMKNLLTNLTCDKELLKELIARKVIFFVNVDQFEQTSDRICQTNLLRNLEYFNNLTNKNFRYNVAVTVSELGKDFTFLYDILRNSKGRILNIRAAPSCIGINFYNQFQKDCKDDYYNKVLAVIKKCRQIEPAARFSSECASNGCMISDALFNQLKSYGYDLRLVCGDPVPNADILPDLSCHWCYAFENIPGMRIANVLDYPDYNSMLNALYRLGEKFKREYPPQCDMESCSHASCKGPCPALNYYFAREGIKLKR